MKSSNVKQVATFEELLGFCHAHGAMYNPSKASISITALESLFTSAQQSLGVVKSAYTDYNNAVNVRQEMFNRLPVFVTRIANALAASDASKATLEEAYAYVTKFRSRAAMRPPISGEEAKAMKAQPKVRRNLQTDFNSRVEHFTGLLKVVSAEPTYQPNEDDLKVVALDARLEELHRANTKVIELRVALSNARAARNKILYAPQSVYDSAKAVKHYVKAVFGFRSVAYNQIRSLRFVTRKIA